MLTSIIIPTIDINRLQENLHKSEIFSSSNFEFIIRFGETNIRQAFNSGKAEAKGDFIFYCHDDVWFPEDFEEKWINCIERLPDNIGVMGFAGVKWNCYNQKQKEYVCSVNDRGLIYGTRVDQSNTLEKVETIDELCLITKNENWSIFDTNAPNRHLYGAELCFKAEKEGLENYIIPPMVKHNAKTDHSKAIYDGLNEAAEYLRKTNPEVFPFATTCGDFY